MPPDVRLTLDRLIAASGDNYAFISTLIGRNTAYIQQFIKRGVPRKLAERDRIILARYFNVPQAVLGAPDNASPSDSHYNIIMVPRLAVGASAGFGSICPSNLSEQLIALDAGWLRSLSAHPHRLSMIRVDGESMHPTLQHGDDLLVDHEDAHEQLRDGIYILRLDDALMVKRVVTEPSNSWPHIVSDNPLYPGWIASDAISIVGRVIWAGRALR